MENWVKFSFKLLVKGIVIKSKQRKDRFECLLSIIERERWRALCLNAEIDR